VKTVKRALQQTKGGRRLVLGDWISKQAEWRIAVLRGWRECHLPAEQSAAVLLA
jgi:hypothetical protein